MDDANIEGLAIVGERLRSEVAALKLSFENNDIPVTISIGLAESPVFGDEADFARQLFAVADAGMYRAKHSGRNRFVIEAFSPVQINEASGNAEPSAAVAVVA